MLNVSVTPRPHHIANLFMDGQRPCLEGSCLPCPRRVTPKERAIERNRRKEARAVFPLLYGNERRRYEWENDTRFAARQPGSPPVRRRVSEGDGRANIGEHITRCHVFACSLARCNGERREREGSSFEVVGTVGVKYQFQIWSLL